MTWPDLRAMRELVARSPLATAFIISLVIHLFLFQGYRLSKRYGWWDYHPEWMVRILRKKPSARDLARLQKAAELAALQRKEILLSFMEVPPDRASPTPPKDAKYYGALNAVAANPDVKLDTPVPKIDGKQNKLDRLETVPKEQKDKFPLMPAPTPDKTREAELQQEKPKPTPTPGDIALVKPDRPKNVNDGKADTPEHTRPRTLQEARARRSMLVGERMRQDGGMRARGSVSVDVKASAFGAYDAAFIAAVQDRWYTILDAYPYALRAGKVVVHFNLMHDGRITEMKVMENTVGELQTLFCQRSIMEPAPYAPWPADMRRLIGDNFREVTFTFYYY